MATLTEFLIALSNSPEVRERYDNPVERGSLLREYELADHPALQPGATIDEMRSAVAGEPDVGAVPDWWILVDQDPIAIGDGWILAAEAGPGEQPDA